MGQDGWQRRRVAAHWTAPDRGKLRRSLVRLVQEPDWSSPGLAMSPDGRSILTVQIDHEPNDLTTVDNFR